MRSGNAHSLEYIYDDYLWRTTATFDQKGKVLFMDSFDATDLGR